MTLAIAPLLVSLIVGYLLGSIPFGLLLTRAAGLGDVRKIGSGNIGATNVLRTGNKGLAAATLLLDGLKATVAIWIVSSLLLPWLAGLGNAPQSLGAEKTAAMTYAWMTGLGAVLGHMFPVWLGFKGGKGVATFIGTLIGAHWISAVLFCGIWLATAAITRLSSLSALVGTLGVLGWVLFTPWPSSVRLVVLLLTVLIFWKHRENISRLLAGTEGRIGQKG